jgi:hypothetical protein
MRLPPPTRCSALNRRARQEVGRAFDDSEHEQSDGREKQDQAGDGDPWRPFAFACVLELVKVLRSSTAPPTGSTNSPSPTSTPTSAAASRPSSRPPHARAEGIPGSRAIPRFCSGHMGARVRRRRAGRAPQPAVAVGGRVRAGRRATLAPCRPPPPPNNRSRPSRAASGVSPASGRPSCSRSASTAYRAGSRRGAASGACACDA